MLQANFFPKNQPEKLISVEITVPIEIEAGSWTCQVRFRGFANKDYDIVSGNSFAVLQLAFQRARYHLIKDFPYHRDNGLWDLEGILPETIPSDYGSDIYLKISNYASVLIQERVAEWGEKARKSD